MAEKKELISGLILRVVYYLLAMCCVFLVFVLAVAFTPERLDAEIILILIIAVLLLAFMLNTSNRLALIQKDISMLIAQKKQSE